MSIDEKTLALINAEIDGENSAKDSARLARLLEDDPEACNYRDELAAMCGELDGLDSAAVPTDLRASVLAEVKTREKPATEPAWQQAFVDWLGMPALRYAVSFGAGVILTFALVASGRISERAFDDVTGLVGTISGAERTSATAIDRFQISLNELSGTVNLSRAGRIAIVDFDLSSRLPIEIVAEFNNRNIWFNGFAQLESTGTSVAAESGRFTVRMQGQRRYAVYLYSDGRDRATLTLRFYATGQLLHEGQLRLDEASR